MVATATVPWAMVLNAFGVCGAHNSLQPAMLANDLCKTTVAQSAPVVAAVFTPRWNHPRIAGENRGGLLTIGRGTMAGMRFPKLRIAWSVFCGLACVLLVVLWVRSYWMAYGIAYTKSPNT